MSWDYTYDTLKKELNRDPSVEEVQRRIIEFALEGTNDD
jgi:hypothetical protein